MMELGNMLVNGLIFIMGVFRLHVHSKCHVHLFIHWAGAALHSPFAHLEAFTINTH